MHRQEVRFLLCAFHLPPLSSARVPNSPVQLPIPVILGLPSPPLKYHTAFCDVGLVYHLPFRLQPFFRARHLQWICHHWMLLRLGLRSAYHGRDAESCLKTMGIEKNIQGMMICIFVSLRLRFPCALLLRLGYRGSCFLSLLYPCRLSMPYQRF